MQSSDERLDDPTDEEIELLLIEEELMRQDAVLSFPLFVKLAWHIVEPDVPYVHSWHVDAIGEHLEAVLDGRIRNLVINMPPRMSKSTLVSVLFPAWVWLRYPGKKFLYSAYAASLSTRDSIKCRRLIESDWYKSFFKITWSMNADQNTQTEFSNTRQGHRIATSVDAAATGKGGDIIVVDDPIKAMDAFSPTIRQRAIDWWDQEMSTRSITPKTVARIIVMQRLHPDDLTGHVLKQGGYVQLKLPMEYEIPRDEFGNEIPKEQTATSIGWTDPRVVPGELLSPDRFGPEEIVELKLRLGSHGYAGQEQQRPAALEGGVIKRAWFKFYKEVPWDLTNHVIAADYATSEKTSADATVLGCAARRRADVYVLDIFKDRMEFPAAVAATKQFVAKHPRALKKKLEKKSNGVAIIQTLKTEIPGIVEVNPTTDKLSRLMAVAPFVEAGNVYLPENAPWVLDFINEICSFAGEGSGHDDQVDVFTMILDEYISQPAVAPPSAVSAAGRGRGY